MAPPAPECLWQIAADPERVAALHGLVGDFCHLLRNRLNSLQMSLYLARRDDGSTEPQIWDELDRQYHAAEGVVELFQVVCRPMTLTPITIGLGLVIADFAGRWGPRFAERGLVLTSSLTDADGPSTLDPSRLSQGLDALAAWRLDRCRVGARTVLRGSVARGVSRLEWSEEGQVRFCPDGELPLAAMARVASAHGGTMTQEEDHGWRVRIEWPNDRVNVSA
jgi:hypothetical protein